MTTVVLVTHHGLGGCLQRQAERILGHDAPLVTVDVDDRADVEETLDRMRRAIAEAREEAGVLVLTDLPGATPHNLAGKAAAEAGVPLVSGLNLPMLLKVITHASETPEALAEQALAGGRQGVRPS